MADPDPEAHWPSGRRGAVQRCPVCNRLHDAADPPTCFACATGRTDPSDHVEPDA